MHAPHVVLLVTASATHVPLVAVEVNAMYAPHVEQMKASVTHVPLAQGAVTAALGAVTRMTLVAILRALLP